MYVKLTKSWKSHVGSLCNKKRSSHTHLWSWSSNITSSSYTTHSSL